MVGPISFTVILSSTGQRLDVYLSEQLAGYSRSYFKTLIDQELVLVNGKKVLKAGYVIKENDLIIVNFPDLQISSNHKDVSQLDVKIVYEHQDFLIINKPAGLVVHSPNQHYDGVTLVDWLLNYFHEIKSVGVLDRPGIVHRLDMLTSGLMIVPRHNQAHMFFTNLFKNRQIAKTYLAIVNGHPLQAGTIDYHIVRHPTHRNKMTHVLPRDLNQNWARAARSAQTGYEVLHYFEHHSLVALKPVTGRTHQIRVHMAALGHILAGDTVYGDKAGLISRQALHAHKLEFNYQGQNYSFIADLPPDLKQLILNFKSDFDFTT